MEPSASNMADEKKHVVAVSNVGGGQLPSEWHTIRAIFHNFADLPAEREDVVCSDSMECHGLDWRISLYPGGCGTSDENDQFISAYLSCLSVVREESKRGRASFRGSVPSAGLFKSQTPEFVFDSDGNCRGWPNFAQRSLVLDPEKKYLVDGNLTVDFDIRVLQDKPPAWSPTKTIGADLLKLLDEADGSNAAVIFEVGKDDWAGFQKKELFYAHRPILAARCPTLATMGEGFGRGTHIPIEDCHPDAFRMLLRFIYGEEIPSKDILKGNAQDIMHAADRYGCIGLKLAAEAEMVSSGTIQTENAAELILFADGGRHALLKEAAINHFVANSEAVMATDGYELLAESPAILKELVAAMSNGNNKKWPNGDLSTVGGAYKDMCVAALRVKLGEKGLDVDGSKEMLVARLEAAAPEEDEAPATEANTSAEEETDGEEENAVDDNDSFAVPEDDPSDDEEEH